MNETTTWAKACASDDVPDGDLWPATVGDVAVCVYRVEGNVYATLDQCTHGNARLSDGFLDGWEVECPFHQGRFDIRTGEATLPPCTEPVRQFSVRENDGVIWISLDNDVAS